MSQCAINSTETIPNLCPLPRPKNVMNEKGLKGEATTEIEIYPKARCWAFCSTTHKPVSAAEQQKFLKAQGASWNQTVVTATGNETQTDLNISTSSASPCSSQRDAQEEDNSIAVQWISEETEALRPGFCMDC